MNLKVKVAGKKIAIKKCNFNTNYSRVYLLACHPAPKKKVNIWMNQFVRLILIMLFKKNKCRYTTKNMKSIRMKTLSIVK